MKKTKAYSLNLPIRAAIAVFSDLEQFAELHPLILSAKFLDTTEANNRRYLIKEKPYPALPFKIKYKAYALVEEKQIEYIVSGIPLFRPKLTYVFSSIDEQQIRATITIEIKGFPIGRKMLLNKMIKAQDDLMQRLIDHNNQGIND